MTNRPLKSLRFTLLAVCVGVVPAWPMTSGSGTTAKAAAGAAADLSGVWRSADGAWLKFRYANGVNYWTGFQPKPGPAHRQGEARVLDARPEGPAKVAFRAQGEGASHGVVSRDRTQLNWYGEDFRRAVPPGFARIKVMSYNMEGHTAFGKISDIAAYLVQEGPDVIGLQEVKTKTDHTLFVFDPDHVNEGQELAKKTGYAWAWGSDRRDEGEALLVRSNGPLKPRIERQRSVPLPAPGASGVDAKRQVLLTQLGVKGGGHVQVVLTHLSNDAQARMQEARFIAPLLRAPGLLMGDCNARPNDPAMKFWERTVVETFHDANPGHPGYNAPAYAPTFKNDYIFLARKSPAQARVLAAWTPAKPKSMASGTTDDHLPVVAVVDVRVR